MWVSNGRALAPPWMVCRIGRLHLGEPAGVQRVADAAHHGRALVGDVARLGPHDQVDVPHPDPRVGVGQALVLVGQRPQRLAGQLHRLGTDRQLARCGWSSPRRSRPTWSPRSMSCSQKVRARAEVLARRPSPAGPRCRRAAWRTRAPHVALEQHASDDRDLDARSSVSGGSRPASAADLGQRVGARVRSPGRGRCPGRGSGRAWRGVPAPARAACSVDIASATQVGRRGHQREHGRGMRPGRRSPAPSGSPRCRRRSSEIDGVGQEPLGAAGGRADAGQVGGVLEAHVARLPRRQVLRVGAVERLQLPVPARQQQRLGATAWRSVRRRSRHRARTPRGTSRSSGTPARRRTSRPRSARQATISSTSPLSAVGSRRIRSSDRPVRPQGTKLRNPRSRPVVVVGLDQHAVAVQRVAEPAERHREAALVAAVAAPLRRRPRLSAAKSAGAQGACRSTGWCSRGAAAGRPTGGPPSCRGR